MPDIAVLRTGLIKQDAGCFFGGVPWATYSKWDDVSEDRRKRITVGVNSLLLNVRGKTVLVDTGYSAWAKELDASGDSLLVHQDRLTMKLHDFGLNPKSIDTVIITSPSFDHINGVTRMDPTGQMRRRFSKAQTYIVDSVRPDTVKLLDDAGVQWEPLVDDHLLPEIEVIRANGIAALKIAMPGEWVMYLSDLCPTHWHLEEPMCNPADDDHRGSTIAAKQELVKEAVKRGYLVVFSHGLKITAGYPEDRGGRVVVRPMEIAV